MAKLKLQLEDLVIDSFDTTVPVKAKGTVFGEQCSCYHTQCTCPGCPTCQNYNTCDGTCPNTCDDVSCAGTCGGSCAGTCDCTWGYTCEGCTMEAANTCFNYGTCDPNAHGGCPVTP